MEFLVFSLMMLFFFYIIFYLFLKILTIPRVFLLFVGIPIALIIIRLNYLWDMFSYTQEIFFPNPLAPGGFLYDILAGFVGGILDGLLGIDFFKDALAWLVGAMNYVVLLTAVHYIFYLFYLSWLANHYHWWWLAAVLFVVWLIAFHQLFYNRGFKEWGLDPLARPDEMTKYCPYFTSYYWVSMVLSAVYVVADIKKRVF